jgi:hypothetical protein
MAGQNSEGKVEVEAEVECALNPERSQYLRRSDRGMAPDISVTAPHCAHLREGNRCGCHIRSWEELTGHAADACQSTPHDDLGSYYSGSKVQVTRGRIPASGRMAAASWIDPRADTSRDGR